MALAHATGGAAAAWATQQLGHALMLPSDGQPGLRRVTTAALSGRFGQVDLPSLARPGGLGGGRRRAKIARLNVNDSRGGGAGTYSLRASAAAVAGAAISAASAVATASNSRARTPKVGKPLVQVSERVANIAHMLGVNLEEAATKPMRWLEVLDQLTRIESRVEELQTVVDQVSAAEDGMSSTEELAAALAANRTTAVVPAGEDQAPLDVHRPAARFAAWPLPWSKAKPVLLEWAEAASGQEARDLRFLASKDDREMGCYKIWAVAAPDGVEVEAGLYLGQPREPQALAIVRAFDADDPPHDQVDEYHIPADRIVVHHVLARPDEVSEPVKVALRDWVESLAPKVVIFPDPTALEAQGLERLLAASTVDPLAGLFL